MHHRLSNGIPVVFQHLDGSAAAFYWWVKVGSTYEEKGEEGFAHFLEHMLFKDATAKDTGRPSTGALAKGIESLGGDINAYTSFDQTVFHVTCAEHHFEKVIKIFSGMFGTQKFLKSDFDSEREVILEELARSEDSPDRQLYQALFAKAFRKHPYGRPVIGYKKTLVGAKKAQLEKFYKKWYRPDNMGLVLAGPIDSDRREKLLQILESTFGSKMPAARGPKPVPKIKSDPELLGEIGQKVVPFHVPSPSLAMSLRVPDLHHDDMPALDVIASVLGSGESSRLYQKLFYEMGIVTDVSAGLFTAKDPGMLYFHLDAQDRDQMIVAAHALIEEVAKFIEEGPSEEEFARCITHEESDKTYSSQTADGVASRAGYLNFVLEDLEFDHLYLERMKSLTSQEIRRVARKYFDCRRLSISALVPKGEEEEYSLEDITQKAQKYFVGPVDVKKYTSSKAVSQPVQTTKIIHGSEALHYNHSTGARVALNSRPKRRVFSLYLGAMGGTRLEVFDPVESAAADIGTSYITSQTWTKGTSTRSGQEIAMQVEGRAASLDGFSGRNSLGLYLSGLSKDWDELSELFEELVLDPKFDEEELEHSRRVTLDSIRSVEKHSAQLCSHLFMESLFENHPYGMPIHGTTESITGIHREKIAQYYARWVQPQNLSIAFSGDIEHGVVQNWVEKLLTRLSGRSEEYVAPQIPGEETLRAPRWVERHHGREQSHIIVGGLGPSMSNDDRHALRLLQTVLGGQSGRLFLELREKKSLAYTVSNIYFEGLEPGYVGTYIGCSPSKREEALKGIESVLETVASKGITQSELNRAREYLLGRRAMDLQSDASIATYMGMRGLYQLPLANEKTSEKRIRSVSAKKIQQVAKKYLVQPKMVTSVVH